VTGSSESACQLLLVEDDEDLRSAMADALGDLGYQVLEAGNGKEALQLARARAPSLILLDLMMPIMDGWTFLRRRAEDVELSAIPVVVLSAQHDEDFPADGGVLLFLRKPPDMPGLVAIIERICAGANATH
jgi:CheY-like chemotaxis protein